MMSEEEKAEATEREFRARVANARQLAESAATFLEEALKFAHLPVPTGLAASHLLIEQYGQARVYMGTMRAEDVAKWIHALSELARFQEWTLNNMGNSLVERMLAEIGVPPLPGNGAYLVRSAPPELNP